MEPNLSPTPRVGPVPVTLPETADGRDARLQEPPWLGRISVALPAGFLGAGAKGKGHVCFALRGRKEAQAG